MRSSNSRWFDSCMCVLYVIYIGGYRNWIVHADKDATYIYTHQNTCMRNLRTLTRQIWLGHGRINSRLEGWEAQRCVIHTRNTWYQYFLLLCVFWVQKTIFSGSFCVCRHVYAESSCVVKDVCARHMSTCVWLLVKCRRQNLCMTWLIGICNINVILNILLRCTKINIDICGMRNQREGCLYIHIIYIYIYTYIHTYIYVYVYILYIYKQIGGKGTRTKHKNS
jgi:hypothetical protein